MGGTDLDTVPNLLTYPRVPNTRTYIRKASFRSFF